MLRSLYSGISGMKVNQTKLDVIGNNIANVGTTSFKSARVRFQDMLSQNISEALGPGRNQGGVNPRQVGLGVQIAGVDTMVSQGMMQPTGRNLDVAVDGDGYFMVAKGPLPDDNGTSVPFLAADADATENSNTIDKENSTLDVFYTRDGSFTLDHEGNLLTSDGNRVLGYSVGGSITYTDGKPELKFVDADSATPLVADAAALVPLVIPDSVEGKQVKTFSIEKDGTIRAVLDGGAVTILGQIAMSSFKNPAGLTKDGKNLYKESANSGIPLVRTGMGAAADVDNSKGYGDMLQGMLEMSNVDLAEQFTDMIVTSRAFQANSKTISTGDEILQEILNLKR